MLLTNESFLTKFDELIKRQDDGKNNTIRLVYKRYIEGQKRWKRTKVKEPPSGAVYCLIRVKIGNTKISTRVESTRIEKFNESISRVIDSI